MSTLQTSEISDSIAPSDPKRIEANPHSLRNRLVRVLWNATYAILYRHSPRVVHKYRVALLKLFGASINWTAQPYPKCRIWLPANLKMSAHSCLADDVDCYNVAPIVLGELAIVSQYSYLCSASHDINHSDFPLIAQPITISRQAWVAARSYIGPGVTLGEGAVAGANSCVYRDVPPWTVVGGNPARPIGTRNQRPLTTQPKCSTPSSCPIPDPTDA